MQLRVAMDHTTLRSIQKHQSRRPSRKTLHNLLKKDRQEPFRKPTHQPRILRLANVAYYGGQGAAFKNRRSPRMGIEYEPA